MCPHQPEWKNAVICKASDREDSRRAAPSNEPTGCSDPNKAQKGPQKDQTIFKQPNCKGESLRIFKVVLQYPISNKKNLPYLASNKNLIKYAKRQENTAPDEEEKNNHSRERVPEMTQTIKFADMNIKTIIINIFQMFKKVEKRFSLLKGDVDGMKKTQNF